MRKAKPKPKGFRPIAGFVRQDVFTAEGWRRVAGETFKLDRLGRRRNRRRTKP